MANLDKPGKMFYVYIVFYGYTSHYIYYLYMCISRCLYLYMSGNTKKKRYYVGSWFYCSSDVRNHGIIMSRNTPN